MEKKNNQTHQIVRKKHINISGGSAMRHGMDYRRAFPLSPFSSFANKGREYNSGFSGSRCFDSEFQTTTGRAFLEDEDPIGIRAVYIRRTNVRPQRARKGLNTRSGPIRTDFEANGLIIRT